MKKLILLLLLILGPATAQTIGSGGKPGPIIGCDKSAAVSVSASADNVKVISLAAAKPTFICGFTLASSAAGLVQITSGTNTSKPCDTGAVPVTGNMVTLQGVPVHHGSGLGAVAVVAAGLDVCILATTGNVQGIITYAQ